MAQEEQYIAIISERLSKPGDTRYIIIDRQTREIKDNGMGRGYKSAQAAHKSFAYKQRERQRREKARQMKAQYRQETSAGNTHATRQGNQPSQTAVCQPTQELVSPFVQEDAARVIPSSGRTAAVHPTSRQTAKPAVTVDPQTGVTKVNTWSGFPPRRHARQQWTSQENTPPPPPESYDAK